ncbi:DNA polymerase delta subunit 4 [Biomphalaria glabrata]|nr:DNA polymerase delta subunit 4-like [Biomphalaria glabrata]
MSNRRITITDSFLKRKKTTSTTRSRCTSKLTKKESPASTCSKKSKESQDTKDLTLLKSFDLTLEYGPCIGITRMERWKRAEKHGLNPPVIVKEIIVCHEHDELFTQSLWNDYPTLK